MDSFNEGSFPRPRHLDLDPFAPLSDDLVAHILALVASNGFCFHPKPRLTAAAVTSGTTTATAAAAAAAIAVSAAVEATADGGDGASAERDDGIAGNVGNAVNVSVNNGDGYARGDARTLRYWNPNRPPEDPDIAVTKVTEPAFSALFAACRRLVSLKLVVPLCLPELPASVSLLQRLTRLDVSFDRDERDNRPDPEPEPRFPESVGSLSALWTLRIRDTYVRALPHILSRLRPLTSLKIDGCAALRQLPDGLGHLKSLQHLDLVKLPALESLPHSIGLLSSLETLHLRDVNVDSLPNFSSAHLSSLKRLLLTSLAHLESLPDGIGELPSLQELTIKSCARLAALPASLSALSSLTALTVQHCDSLDSLPEDIGDVPCLASLVLDDLPSLAAISDSLALLSSLMHLHAANCQDLALLPASFAGMQSLSQLHLLGCSLGSLPEDLGQVSGLTELQLSKVAGDPPDSFGQLLKLKRLTIHSFCELENLPETIGQLTALRTVEIAGCGLLETLPESFSQLPNLESLTLGWKGVVTKREDRELGFQTYIYDRVRSSGSDSDNNNNNNDDDDNDDESRKTALTDLPSMFGQLASSLTTLEIHGCHELQQLPASFTQLTRLQRLCISNCHKLRGMPAGWGNLVGLQDDMQQAITHLSSLQHLCIEHNPALTTVPILSSLESLHLYDLSRVSPLSFPNIHALQKLQVLTLHALPRLSPLPPSITALSHLQRLHLLRMDFSNLPEDLGQMQGLRVLTIDTSPNLSTLPASLTLLTSLQHLMVSLSDTFSSLPEDGFGNLSSLLNLSLKHLPLLLKLPVAVSRLASLQVLDVEHCENLSELPEGLESVRSLREVYVDGCSQLDDALEPLLARAGTIQVHM
ncbi:unnamed protein product [Closterium sp. NIES-64]|nr:unnamed protein product [Closterium sp. NIES-64]